MSTEVATETHKAETRTPEETGDQGHKIPPPSIAKQIPCRFFPTGSCKYGDQCAFAHVIPQDLFVPGVNSQFFEPPQGKAPLDVPPAAVPLVNGAAASDEPTQSSSKSEPNQQAPDAPAYPNYFYDPYSYPYYYDQSNPYDPTYASQIYGGIPPPLGSTPNNRFNGRGSMRRNNNGKTYSGSHSRSRQDAKNNGQAVPCAFFEAKKCRNGDECAFAHILPDGTDARDPAKVAASQEAHAAKLKDERKHNGRHGDRRNRFEDKKSSRKSHETTKTARPLSPNDFPSISAAVADLAIAPSEPKVQPQDGSKKFTFSFASAAAKGASNPAPAPAAPRPQSSKGSKDAQKLSKPSSSTVSKETPPKETPPAPAEQGAKDA